MEDTKKISQEEIKPLIIKAIEDFKQLCTKFDDEKQHKLNAVNQIIRREGKSQFDSTAVSVFADKLYSSFNEETKGFLSLSKANEDAKIKICQLNTSIFFENPKKEVDEEINIDFSQEYNESFAIAQKTMAQFKVTDEQGNDMPGVIEVPENEGQTQLAEGLISAVVSIGISMVVGSMIGNAVTSTIKSSPVACSWVRNLCERYPVASRIIDYITFTDLEAIQMQDKINKGEIDPEELESGEGEENYYEGEDEGNIDDWFTPQQGEQALVTDGGYDMIEIDDNGNIVKAHKKEE